jgi:anaphase-promoting complex subunit 1
LNPPQVTELSESMSDSEVCCFYDLLGRNDLSALSTKASRASVYTDLDVTSNQDDPDKDGLVALEDYSSMVFPEDNRIREAARLLRSSRTLFLRVPRPVEQTDHEYERSKQEKLLLLCRRSIALPLGRGMITLGSYNIQSSEQLFMPNIVLAGRVPPTNGTLALGECMLSFPVKRFRTLSH